VVDDGLQAFSRFSGAGVAQLVEGEGQGELGEEVLGGQEADPLAERGAPVVQRDERRRPAEGEAAADLGVLAGEDADGDELLVQRSYDRGVGVRGGVQPPAAASTMGPEVEVDGALALFGLLFGLFQRGAPLDAFAHRC
jgi:hypothetical protein